MTAPATHHLSPANRHRRLQSLRRSLGWGIVGIGLAINLQARNGLLPGVLPHLPLTARIAIGIGLVVVVAAMLLQRASRGRAEDGGGPAGLPALVGLLLALMVVIVGDGPRIG